jgi:acetyl esterase/lipase
MSDRATIRAELVRLGARLFIKRRARHERLRQTRHRFRALEALVPKPPRGTVTTPVSAGGVPADRVALPAAQPDCDLLYLHGGAYRVGSPATYRHFTWRLAGAVRASVLVIDYRLAPEHPFPAALEDAVSSYSWLLAHGSDPRRLVIVGDSAGGGLALALLLKLRDEGLPIPAGAAVVSPWTDLALTGNSLTTNSAADPMLNADDVPGFAADYLAGTDPHHPYASPLYGDPAGLPPILIQIGSDEILYDDAVRMADRLRRASCEVELQIWPRMPHVWHLFAPILPEARQAIAAIGRFLRSRMDTGPAGCSIPTGPPLRRAVGNH